MFYLRQADTIPPIFLHEALVKNMNVLNLFKLQWDWLRILKPDASFINNWQKFIILVDMFSWISKG